MIILVLNGVCWFQEREAKEAQAGDVLNVESEVRDQVMSHEPRVHRKKLKEVLDSLQAVLVGPGCSSCYTSRPCWYLVVTYVQSLLSCNAGAFRQQKFPRRGASEVLEPQLGSWRFRVEKTRKSEVLWVSKMVGDKYEDAKVFPGMGGLV